MNDEFDNARADREALARYGSGPLRPGEGLEPELAREIREREGTLATAEDIRVVLRDALNVYDDAVNAQLDGHIWDGPGNEYARTWLRQRRTIATQLVQALEQISPDVLRLTLTHGKDIEI